MITAPEKIRIERALKRNNLSLNQIKKRNMLQWPDEIKQKYANYAIENDKCISDLQKKLGQINFYKKLIKFDPKIKNLVNQNDYQRSIRAYEVKKFTRKSIVDWHKDTKPLFMKDTFVSRLFLFSVFAFAILLSILNSTLIISLLNFFIVFKI